MYVYSKNKQSGQEDAKGIIIKNLFLFLLSVVSLISCGADSPKVDDNNGQPGETSNSKGVSILVTTADKSSQLTRDSIDLKMGSASSANNRILLVPATSFQKMDGFGAAVTGSTAYNLLRMTSENRTKFLQQTFSEKYGYGFSYIRVSIGCSDFSLSEYTCCDKQGIENFSLTSEETSYVIPVLKEILAINPNVKIIAAPWTAPRWMKVSESGGTVSDNSWTGGHVAAQYYQDYATYFVKWIKAFQSEGINIYAITPQNEPLNSGNSASTLMTWQEEQSFVKNALGPQIQQAGLDTKIYVYDHNYDEYNFPLNIYNDSIAAKYISGSAFHNYVGDKNTLNTVHNANPNKDILFTEASNGTWNDGRNLNSRLITDMEEVALGNVNNWCKSVIVWNLMLNSDMGPNRSGGCQSCFGAVDISSSDYMTISKNSFYFIIAHLAAVVKPNAYRIATTNSSNLTGITSSAFQNPDGSYAVVLANRNAEIKVVTISDGTYYFNYSCPAQSVVSFGWDKTSSK